MKLSDLNEARQFSNKKWTQLSIDTLEQLLGSGYSIETKKTKDPAYGFPAYRILKDNQPTKGYLIIKYESGQFGIESSYIGDGTKSVLEWKPTAQPSWNPTKKEVINKIS